MRFIKRMLTSLVKKQSIVLNYSGQSVRLFKKKSNQFYIQNKPEDILTVAQLTFSPPLTNVGRGVSKGAVAGAGAYATLGKNPLKGAIIGDWLENQRKSSTTETHRMVLLLKSENKGTTVIKMTVTEAAAKTIYHFFKE